VPSKRPDSGGARHGRGLNVHPQHELLAAARRQADTEAFQRTYTRWRPMVERSLAWLVRKGNRRVAYRGIERNRIWLSHRVAAVDLRRLLNLGLYRTPEGWAVA
jgi:IS5 family transposase